MTQDELNELQGAVDGVQDVQMNRVLALLVQHLVAANPVDSGDSSSKSKKSSTAASASAQEGASGNAN